MTHFFLVGNHVLKHGHLRNLLETTLSHGHVCRLGGYQQERRVVPVGSFYRCNKICDTGAVLANQHTHLAGGAGESVRHHACTEFMPTIPESDTCFGKQVGNRHHRRTNNTKRAIDSMHLKNFYKSFFGGHFLFAHFILLLSVNEAFFIRALKPI